jgi:hypothetical protein
MPNLPYIYAGDFMKVLREKHASNSYAKMVSLFVINLLGNLAVSDWKHVDRLYMLKHAKVAVYLKA